jgi:hypothetical protein
MQKLNMTLTTHKAQPWGETLSQAQQDKTVMRPWGEALSHAQQDKKIMRPGEDALSQCSSCCCGLGYSCNHPPQGSLTRSPGPWLYHLNG